MMLSDGFHTNPTRERGLPCLRIGLAYVLF
jgi:hypothetical protein